MRREDWRLLQADEIELRTGQKTKDGTKQSLLLYKDARCDMARLDEQFGQFGWQREHKDVHGVSYCGVGLWDEDTRSWVWKWDAGEKSKTSPEKGEASDAFKRACVNWGIGRELYSAPSIWVSADLDPRKLRVASISYNNSREISALSIVDDKDIAIWSKGAQNGKKSVIKPKELEAAQAPKEAPKPQPAQQDSEIPVGLQMTDRELDEYTGACADMDNSTCREDVVAIWNRYRDASFSARLLEHGQRIINERKWFIKA